MNFVYTLKRSPSRRTISIKINADNTIVVSCPKRTSLEKVERFLSEKSGWIEKHLRKNELLNGQFCDVIAMKTLLIKGEEVPFRITDRDSYGQNGVCLTSISKLKKFYVENFGGEFINLLGEISGKTHLKYTKADFRAYKSRWGCCNKNRELTFNYKLLMLPVDLWVYVIVHELCHTEFMDHSSSFWKCVQSCLPDYKNRIGKIKRYSFLCRMY